MSLRPGGGPGGFADRARPRALGRRGRGAGAGRQDRELAAGFDGVAFGFQDLGERARRRGRNLDRDLVGLELAEHLVGGHGIAHGLEPGGHRGLGDAFAERGDHDVDRACAAGAVGGGGRRGALLLVMLHGTGGGGSALGNGREQRVDAHGGAFACDDLGQGAGHGRGNLHGDLVGLELAEHLVDRDAFAGLLEPGGDRGLGDAFPKRGDADFGAHDYFPSSVSASSTRAACCALWAEARPVAGEAAAARPA